MLSRVRLVASRRWAVAAAGAVATCMGTQLADCKAAPKSLAADLGPTFITTSRNNLSQTLEPCDTEASELTLEYFALQGLGELGRLILEMTGTPYTSVFHFNQKPSIFKQYARFGQLPVLRDGELLVAQSGAIARHLARKLFLDGGSAADKAAVDEWFELSRDLNGKKAAIHDMQANTKPPNY